jgi:hypothetical protein
MATNSSWTVVFEDKVIIKQYGDAANTMYKIDDNTFWNDSKWSNIWAIQYVADNEDHNDTVEYRDETPHNTWTAANLGNFQTQFIDKWDAAHLTYLQTEWDQNDGNTYDEDGNVTNTETESEKITRLGPRPTSYSS